MLQSITEVSCILNIFFLSGSNNVVINGGSAAGDGLILGSKNNIIGPDALLPTTGSANTILGYG